MTFLLMESWTAFAKGTAMRQHQNEPICQAMSKGIKMTFGSHIEGQRTEIRVEPATLEEVRRTRLQKPLLHVYCSLKVAFGLVFQFNR